MTFEDEYLSVLENHLFKSPIAFAKKILDVEPSPDQARFLEAGADLENDRIIVSAPRNVGKTWSLAILALWSCCELPKQIDQNYKIAVLGGKYKQAELLHEQCVDWILDSEYLQDKLEKEPIKGLIQFEGGSNIRTLAASKASVHGIHPTALFLDESVDAEDDIIKTAMQMTGHSQYERQILTSTPYDYNSYFVEIWNNAEDLGWKKFHFSVNNCPWIDESRIEQARQDLEDDLFQIEWLGEPTPVESMVFAPDEIRECIVDEEPEEREEGVINMGVDFGVDPSPTAIVIAQLQDDVWTILKAEEYTKMSPDELLEKVEEVYQDYKPSNVFGDAEAKTECMRLRENGIPVSSTAFQYKREKKMIPNLKRLIREEKIRFPEQECLDLLDEMGKMEYSLTKDDRITSKRAGVDLVDALLLCLTEREKHEEGFEVLVS